MRAATALAALLAAVSPASAQERPPTRAQERPPTRAQERPPTRAQERPPALAQERPPALAQERPPAAPTRDVDVLYRTVAGGQAVEQRSRFAVAAGKVRIDTPSPGLYVIVDRGARQMDMVSQGDRRVLELPYDASRSVTGVAAGGEFQRLGSDVVAGLACTEWRTADASGHNLTLCMTADGVLLRVRAGGAVLVQAVRVAYGPIDPAVFAVPAGYQHMVGRGATR